MNIAVITQTYPSPSDPYRGVAISSQVSELRKLGKVDVYYCRPSYPAWSLLQPRHFTVCRDENDILAGDGVYGVRYPALPLVTRPLNGLSCYWNLRRLLERNRPDVILAYFVYPEGYGAVLAGERLQVPVIIGAIGSDLRRISDPICRKLVQHTLRRAVFITTVSEELRQQALGLGAAPESVRMITNGCDLSVFNAADRGAARAELGINPSADLILYVGTLTNVKGVRELVSAAAVLSPSFANLQVVCIGEGPLKDGLVRTAREKGLATRITFPGGCSPRQIARWLAASNVFCFPSYSEGSPNAVREALACGRPVVASDVGGIPELVHSGCGMLVPPKDSGKLAKALEQALRCSWDEQLIASRSRRTWADMAREIFDLCHEAMLASAAMEVSVP